MRGRTLLATRARRRLTRARAHWRKRVAGLVPALRARAWQGPEPWWLSGLPSRTRTALRLDPPPAGQRRVEIGSGYCPHPGYVHVELFPDAPGVDLVAPGDRLPLADGWADELLSVHMIEHVAPPRLAPTLAEWRRVLRPGGKVVVHTPNGESLARALLDLHGGDDPRLWAVQNAVFGYWLGPEDVGSPERFTAPPDHKVLMTFGLLEGLLHQAGFTDVADVTGRDECHHRRSWEPLVPGLCLEVEACRGPAGGAPA